MGGRGEEGKEVRPKGRAAARDDLLRAHAGPPPSELCWRALLRQMDPRFGKAKLAAAFIAANNCASMVGENGTWDEWNWELDYPSFLEASPPPLPPAPPYSPLLPDNLHPASILPAAPPSSSSSVSQPPLLSS
jgi:hypothetical protein